MKKRSTHNRLTKSLFPWLPADTIDSVNKAMDKGEGLGAVISLIVDPLVKADPKLSMGVNGYTIPNWFD